MDTKPHQRSGTQAPWLTAHLPGLRWQRGRARQDTPGKCPGPPGVECGTWSPFMGPGPVGPRAPRRRRARTACTWPSPTRCPPEVCFRSVSADSSVNAPWDGSQSRRAVAPGTRPAPVCHETARETARSLRPSREPRLLAGAGSAPQPDRGARLGSALRSVCTRRCTSRGGTGTGFTDNLHHVTIS